MKIKTSLLDLLGKEVFAVFKKQDDIFVLSKQKINSMVFAKDNKIACKTNESIFMAEDVCLDIEQVKARINFLQKTIEIIKPKTEIIKP
jgi:hypothetical protein